LVAWTLGIHNPKDHDFGYELNELEKFLLTHCITGSGGGSALQEEPAQAGIF
jgi:transcriptional regulatory protein LevR